MSARSYFSNQPTSLNSSEQNDTIRSASTILQSWEPLVITAFCWRLSEKGRWICSCECMQGEIHFAHYPFSIDIVTPRSFHKCDVIVYVPHRSNVAQASSIFFLDRCYIYDIGCNSWGSLVIVAHTMSTLDCVVNGCERCDGIPYDRWPCKWLQFNWHPYDEERRRIHADSCYSSGKDGVRIFLPPPDPWSSPDDPDSLVAYATAQAQRDATARRSTLAEALVRARNRDLHCLYPGPLLPPRPLLPPPPRHQLGQAENNQVFQWIDAPLKTSVPAEVFSYQGCPPVTHAVIVLADKLPTIEPTTEVLEAPLLLAEEVVPAASSSSAALSPVAVATSPPPSSDPLERRVKARPQPPPHPPPPHMQNV